MNPLAIFTLPRVAIYAAIMAAVVAAAWWFSDKIGDSRELDVRANIAKQEEKTNEAAETGRARARACHARGPEWLWNVAEARCDRPGAGVPKPRP